MQLNRNDLLRAYRSMRSIREFEQRVSIEFMAGNIPGFVHLYAGQEASAVGICMNLTDADKIGSTHRGHGHCIAKGCDIKGMMHEIFAKSDGVCGGKGGSMHIADLSKGMLGANAIVGGAPPLAVGAALAAKVSGDGSVGVAFCGDGGSNQGTTFESMNMAVVLQVPCIFVFENNGFGEGTGVDYAVGSKDIAGRAAAFGMPAVRVDGTNFFEVYEAGREAVERARAGLGPSAIETVSKRFNGHFIGDPQHYRSEAELKAARGRDCLEIFAKRVTESGLLDVDQLTAIDREVVALVDEAVSTALVSPFPTEADLLTDVYFSY